MELGRGKQTHVGNDLEQITEGEVHLVNSESKATRGVVSSFLKCVVELTRGGKELEGVRRSAFPLNRADLATGLRETNIKHKI